MTNQEYWDALIHKYETMSDEEFSRILENTEENTASFFFLENDCIEYVFDSFTEDVNRMKYHVELVNVQDFFSADMDEEGFAA